ncbi:hypothetical protein PSHT_00604 [Puccinia striiformis]|uniref:Uncharacterized protein n=3 Tax=Puccinia striiformis TaxID=27350 RepID=A0A2S4WMS9_9BASI|nr:hypothetical protein PSHT_00604 [Puccinia striiformis]
MVTSVHLTITTRYLKKSSIIMAMTPSAPPNWIEIKHLLEYKYYIHAGDVSKCLMWVMVAVFPVAIVLHIISAIKRGQRAGFWVVRCDSEGYINENRHVLIHALSALKTTAVCVAVVLMQRDVRTHVHFYAVACQATGFALMHIHNWHRTWASIYSMPPTSLYLNLNQGRGKGVFHRTDRIFPPWLFNLGLIGGSLYGIVLTIVAATVMCTSINRDNSLYETVSRIVDENIILSHNPTPQSKMHLMNNSVIFLRGLEGMKEESHRILRALQYLVCGFVAINIVSVALFWWSLHAIIRCLNGQLETYSRCLRNREEAIQLGMISVCPDVPDDTKMITECIPAPKTEGSIFEGKARTEASYAGTSSSGQQGGSWNSWFPSLKSDDIAADHLLWKSTLMRSIKPEGKGYRARLRSDHAILRRCKTNTIWQAVFITLMSWSYTSMAIALGANAFDVPSRTSITQLGFYVILWSNSIWVVGGTALAVLSARVAFMETSTPSHQKASADVECQATKSFDY